MEQDFDCYLVQDKGIDAVRTDLELFPDEIIPNREQIASFIARAELCLFYTFEVEVMSGIRNLKKMIKKPLKNSKKPRKFRKRSAETAIGNEEFGEFQKEPSQPNYLN